MGTQPLDSLTIRLPRLLEQPNAVRAEVAGQRVALAAPQDGHRRIVLPLIPPLAPRRARQFRLAYALPAPREAFVWEPGDWFATTVPPAGAFAFGDRRAGHLRLSIFVPSGYQAFTTGRSLGVRRAAGQTEFRYEIQPADFDPFLLVGRYDERKISVGRRQVIFWTLAPLEAGCAQSAAAHLAATFDFYRSIFGPVWKNQPPIPVIQVSGPLEFPIEAGGGRARSVAGGVLLDLSPSEICARPRQFFQLADRALAATWFGWAVRPEPGARAILGAGAGRYALLAANEQEGGPQARARLVAQWLGEYDRLRPGAKALTPSRLGDHATPDQRRMAGIQAALGFVALEDQYGPQPIRRALAHLVRTLRGDAAGVDELRSALEQETGENLYAFFEQWFGRPLIPAAFQDRYRPAQSGMEPRTDELLMPRRAK